MAHKTDVEVKKLMRKDKLHCVQVHMRNAGIRLLGFAVWLMLAYMVFVLTTIYVIPYVGAAIRLMIPALVQTADSVALDVFVTLLWAPVFGATAIIVWLESKVLSCMWRFIWKFVANHTIVDFTVHQSYPTEVAKCVHSSSEQN